MLKSVCGVCYIILVSIVFRPVYLLLLSFEWLLVSKEVVLNLFREQSVAYFFYNNRVPSN